MEFTVGYVGGGRPTQSNDVTLQEVGEHVASSVLHSLPAERLAHLGHHLPSQLMARLLGHSRPKLEREAEVETVRSN